MAGGEARSVALETAYVHEVYEEISGATNAWSCGCSPASAPASSRAWPKVAQFLHELEPGALVCDVGCGNGKYLSINPAVFKIGVDRCQSLTELAREKEHEVLVCDNLALPFRDECFDAVLSVAVVHHLATTERRVSAIRELARVLRIGGRLIITVWAMEQRHRKFESQDVLVPWHRPQQLSTPSLELTSTTTTSEEDLHPPYHAYTQTSDSDSCRSHRLPGQQRRRGRSRHKGRTGRSIDTAPCPGRPVSSSQSSSSLSSPNETCYSFVRRALQKLAGGKRSAPWFLDTWANGKDPPHRHEPEGCEDANDIQDLPIELHRLEEEAEPRAEASGRGRRSAQDALPLHLKSKSLSDILSTDARALVRSRSSVPSVALGGLGGLSGLGGLPCNLTGPQQVPSSSRSSSSSVSVKPRLVKQKQSMCEEQEAAEVEQEEAAGGDQPTDMRNLVRALPDFKRLHGAHGGSARGRAAKFNVFKQSSMNEELMSAERLREKERVRQNIQKQASLNEDLMYRRAAGQAGAGGTLDSLRDTLFSASTAKRFQLLKIGLTSKLKSSTTNIEKVAVRMLQGWKQAGETAADPSAPPAPPAPPGPPHVAASRQGSLSGSLTPSTPPPDMMSGHKRPSSGSIHDEALSHARARSSSGTFGHNGERRHSREDGSDSSKDSSLQSDTSVDSEDSFASVIFVPRADQLQDAKTPSPTLCSSACSSAPASPQPNGPPGSGPPPWSPAWPPGSHGTPSSPKVLLLKHSPSPCSSPQMPSSPRLGPTADVLPLPLSIASAPGAAEASGVPVIPVLPTKDDRLQQIKDMLRQKNVAGRGMFPLVRRSSGSLPRPTPPRAAPRLLSLELFNPETDDVDSDSSGVSSPDSVDSVISVATTSRLAARSALSAADESLRALSRTPSPAPERHERAEHIDSDDAGPSQSVSTSGSLSLLEAAADVATTLEDAVEAVIQASPRARRRHIDAADVRVALEDDTSRSSWSLQLSPDSSPNPRESRMKESASRFSLPGSLTTTVATGNVFKFPSTSNCPVKTVGRAGSAGRLHEGVDFTSMGAIPRKADSEPLPLNAKAESEASLASLAAIPETPDPFGLQAGLQGGTVPSPLVLSPREGQVADGSVGLGSPPEEDCWDDQGVHDGVHHEVRQHLAGFAEQLSERLLEEIERYREETAPASAKDPYLTRLGEELQGLSKLSLELRERPCLPGGGSFDKVIASLAKNVDSSSELLARLTKDVKDVSKDVSLAGSLPSSLPSLDSSEGLTALTGVSSMVSSFSSSIRSTRSTDGDSAPQSDLASEASDMDAEVSVSGNAPPPSSSCTSASRSQGQVDAGLVAHLRSGCSVESSDGGDFSERTGSMTGSGTDSRRDTSSACSAHGSHGKTASSASQASFGTMESDAASDCSRDVRFADRRTARCDGRSSSEEAPGPPAWPTWPPRAAQLVRQKAAERPFADAEPPEGVTKTESYTTSLSGSTSQDSLPSDNGGGAITFHRYYHVFREGELDQLIERYVENLHIISSYYDHTNWCVVAEKVQVWTI